MARALKGHENEMAGAAIEQYSFQCSLRVLAWAALLGTCKAHYRQVDTTVTQSAIGLINWGTFGELILPFVIQRLGFDQASPRHPAWQRSWTYPGSIFTSNRRSICFAKRRCSKAGTPYPSRQSSRRATVLPAQHQVIDSWTFCGKVHLVGATKV